MNKEALAKFMFSLQHFSCFFMFSLQHLGQTQGQIHPIKYLPFLFPGGQADKG